MHEIGSSLLEPALHCPVVSPRLILGPKEYLHGKPMHYAKLRGNTTYFRLGEREAFLLALMNGTRTPLDIQTAYAQHFRKRLSPTSWQAGFDAFKQCGFLLSEQRTNTVAMPQAAPSPMGREQDGPFSFKLVHWDLDEQLSALVPRVRVGINGFALGLLGLALLLCELLVARHLHAIWGLAASTAQPVSRVTAFLLIATLMTVLHECAHAISCKCYGGQVREVGLLVRYFMLCAYTRVDDILLFQRRRERVYVLLVGPMVSLTILPFAFVLWQHAPVHSLSRVVAADLLLWYNLFSLAQFLPIMKFDGYYVLAQILHMPELRTDSYAYLIALAKFCLGRGKRYSISPQCAPYVETACVIYGLFSWIATSALIFVLLRNDVLSLHHVLSGPLFSGLIGCLALWIVWRLYQKLQFKGRPMHQ